MPPVNMDDRWVDVFITKEAKDSRTRPQAVYNAATQSWSPVSTTGASYTYDDQFCCSVQTVQFDPDQPNIAYVVETDTPWILPTWTTEYNGESLKSNPYAKVAVGDIVRLGSMQTSGFTDYLTVVEVRTVDYLANGTSSQLRLSKSTTGNVAGTDFLALPTTSSTPTGTNLVTLGKNGIAHIAIRVNAVLNCTILPSSALDNSKTEIYHRQGVETKTNKAATLATRHLAYQHLTQANLAYEGEVLPSENYYYPLYLNNSWMQETTLVARLDHGVKQLAGIKLIGYSFVNKQQVGIQHAHEMITDDYVILNIKEIQGKVISNNQFAHGAFAVLHSGNTRDNLVGAAEMSMYDINGIVCATVPPTNAIRNLTIEVTDRRGRPAHFGRFHLWFKLLVTHG